MHKKLEISFAVICGENNDSIESACSSCQQIMTQNTQEMLIELESMALWAALRHAAQLCFRLPEFESRLAVLARSHPLSHPLHFLSSLQSYYRNKGKNKNLLVNGFQRFDTLGWTWCYNFGVRKMFLAVGLLCFLESMPSLSTLWHVAQLRFGKPEFESWFKILSCSHLPLSPTSFPALSPTVNSHVSNVYQGCIYWKKSSQNNNILKYN